MVSVVTCIGGKPDEDTLNRIDVSLRLGNAPAPWGLPGMGLPDEYVTYAAEPGENAGFQMKRAGKRAHGAIAEDRCVLLEELLNGKKKGRMSDKQVTYSERGNIQERSSLPLPAGFTSSPGPKDWAGKFRRSGCCRISGIEVF
ncbi:MAG: hypothetical protein ACREQV_18225 [Candidatus Binatia bacterium]